MASFAGIIFFFEDLSRVDRRVSETTISRVAPFSRCEVMRRLRNATDRHHHPVSYQEGPPAAVTVIVERAESIG